MIIYTPLTEASNKNDVTLARVLYIHYLLYFQKITNKLQALLNFGSKVNTMTSVYISKLSFKVCYTNVRTQKIDSSILEIFGIVLASFYIKNKPKKTWFF